MSVNGTLVEAKMRAFTIESTHFMFNKCPFYTHDSASAKFSTKSHETDYSVANSHWLIKYQCLVFGERRTSKIKVGSMEKNARLTLILDY